MFRNVIAWNLLLPIIHHLHATPVCEVLRNDIIEATKRGLQIHHSSMHSSTPLSVFLLLPFEFFSSNAHTHTHVGNFQRLREILDGDLTQRDCVSVEDGATPLMYACVAGRLDMVEELVQRGCEVNKQDALNGWTALMQAVFHGCVCVGVCVCVCVHCALCLSLYGEGGEGLEVSF